ncbi:MAG: sugar ABC transporter permease [Bacillota bacterium]|nr:sugar ABC transporter permease [Bacillota bacterium]
MAKKGLRFGIFVYLLPALTLYTLFMAYPLIMSLGMSLYEWKGYGPTTFVGLANFKKLLFLEPFSTRFFNALTNNIKFFAYTTLFQNVVALFLAVLLTKKLRGTEFYRTVYFMPVTLSVLIVGFIWTLILNPTWGVLNKGLEFIGLVSWAKPWLGDPNLALPVIAFVNSWQFIGLPIMMFVAGIRAIPEELFEAARIDGCNEWQVFRNVTLPGLVPVIGLVMILTLVGNFSSFEIIYSMAGTLAGPNYATDVLGTLFYRTSFSSISGAPPSMGMGAAIAVFMFTIICAGVLSWFYIDSKINNS